MKLYDTLLESLNDGGPIIKGTYSCVLIGGYDDRPGDKTLSWQVEQLKNATGINDIKGFRYNVLGSELCSFIKQNPNILVFMFSKGCEKFNVLMSCNNSKDNKVYVNKNRIYIIEPWVGSSGALSNFNTIASKIPANHIFVGGNATRGKGINGAVSSNAKLHWDAIASVGNMLGGLIR